MVRSARSRVLSLVVAIVLIVSAIFVSGQISSSATSTGSSARVAVATRDAAARTGEADNSSNQPAAPAARVTVSTATTVSQPAEVARLAMASEAETGESESAAAPRPRLTLMTTEPTETAVATRPRVRLVTGAEAAATPTPQVEEEAALPPVILVTPIPEEETPVPAEETPTPVEETPAAVEETATPVEETPLPAEETPIAAEETPLPAEETPTPVEETPFPEEETPTPVEETPAPVEETPLPEEEAAVTVPVTETAEMTVTAEAAATLDVVETLRATDDLSTMAAALEASGLADILQSEGPYTIFAPTDEAFDALPAGRLDELMADPGGDLLDILLYHMLPGQVMVDDITDGMQSETIQGAQVTFTVGAEGAQINSAAIITPDIEATNGVVHVIDAVLSAPVGEGAEVPPGEEAAPSGVMTATGVMTDAEGTTPTDEVTETTLSTLTVPIIVSGDVADTGEITDTGSLTDSETLTEPVSMNTTDAAAAEAAVVVSPPASMLVSPIAAPAGVWIQEGGTLEVFGPEPDGAYHSPITVTGLSQTFTGNVTVSLVAEDGTLLAERATVGGMPAAAAFFHTYLRFTVDEPVAAQLNVVDMDMADGTVVAQMSVPVTLLPGQRFVDVTYPAVGDLVCGSLAASGYSNTFEANVVVEVLDRDGATVLDQVPAMGGAYGFYRDFAASLAYTAAEGPEPLLLAAYEIDASERYPHIDRIVVPFTLYPADSDVCDAAGQ